VLLGRTGREKERERKRKGVVLEEKLEDQM